MLTRSLISLRTGSTLLPRCPEAIYSLRYSRTRISPSTSRGFAGNGASSNDDDNADKSGKDVEAKKRKQMFSSLRSLLPKDKSRSARSPTPTANTKPMGIGLEKWAEAIKRPVAKRTLNSETLQRLVGDDPTVKKGHDEVYERLGAVIQKYSNIYSGILKAISDEFTESFKKRNKRLEKYHKVLRQRTEIAHANTLARMEKRGETEDEWRHKRRTLAKALPSDYDYVGMTTLLDKFPVPNNVHPKWRETLERERIKFAKGIGMNASWPQKDKEQMMRWLTEDPVWTMEEPPSNPIDDDMWDRETGFYVENKRYIDALRARNLDGLDG